MTRVYNQKPQTPLRRHLRRESPKAERLIWWRLRGKQLDGMKFRRQYGVGPHVVDVYCPAAKLAVEVDGESHFDWDAEARDEQRRTFIEAFGILVLRFTNPQVYDELDAVVERIWEVATERVAMLKSKTDGEPPPRSPLGKGGGRIGDDRCDGENPPQSPLGKGGGQSA